MLSLVLNVVAQRAPPLEATVGGIPVSANTQYGPIVGRYSRSDDVNRYWGVPYGADTSGANRFKHAQPPAPWTTPLETIKKNYCFQIAMEVPAGSGTPGAAGTEDCLSLSITAPGAETNPGVTGNAAPNTYPVQVWIYGGGFFGEVFPYWQFKDNFYANSEQSYLANNGKTVTVAINYRLGNLGFASHPSMRNGISGNSFSGNWGASDVYEGLKWVNTNIGNFGGDPSKVTIMGESAGATLSFFLFSSPKLYSPTQLIHRYVGQSLWPVTGKGSMFSQVMRDAAGDKLAVGVGCTTDYGTSKLTNAVPTWTSIATCLRGKTAFEIQSGGVLATSAGFNAVHGPNSLEAMEWQGYQMFPCVDGFFHTINPMDSLASGVGSSVHVILGHNADDFVLFQTAYMPVDSVPYLLTMGSYYSQYHPSASIYTNASEYARLALSMPSAKLEAQPYYKNVVNPFQRQTQQANDGSFASNIGLIFDTLAAQTGRPANSLFRYLLAEPNLGSHDLVPAFGSPHTMDLNYLWGYASMKRNWLFDNIVLVSSLFSYGADQKALGNTMHDYWNNFFHTGSPNVVGDGLPEWKAISSSEKHTMVFQTAMSRSGAKLDPCVALTSCVAEPTADFRRERTTFFASAFATAPPAATCDPIPDNVKNLIVGSYSHTSTATYGATCPYHQCQSWCNSFTCSVDACTSCPVCQAARGDGHCAAWCNSFTCGKDSCQGCGVCELKAAGKLCSPWCSEYTTFMSQCAAC